MFPPLSHQLVIFAYRIYQKGPLPGAGFFLYGNIKNFFLVKGSSFVLNLCSDLNGEGLSDCYQGQLDKSWGLEQNANVGWPFVQEGGKASLKGLK